MKSRLELKKEHERRISAITAGGVREGLSNKEIAEILTNNVGERFSGKPFLESSVNYEIKYRWAKKKLTTVAKVFKASGRANVRLVDEIYRNYRAKKEANKQEVLPIDFSSADVPKKVNKDYKMIEAAIYLSSITDYESEFISRLVNLYKKHGVEKSTEILDVLTKKGGLSLKEATDVVLISIDIAENRVTTTIPDQNDSGEKIGVAQFIHLDEIKKKYPGMDLSRISVSALGKSVKKSYVDSNKKDPETSKIMIGTHEADVNIYDTKKDVAHIINGIDDYLSTH